MNGDAVTIMKAISDMRADLKEDIGDIKKDIGTMNGEFTADIKNVKERVGDLEHENVREHWKQWLERGMFAGIFLGIHKILNLIGFKV